MRHGGGNFEKSRVVLHELGLMKRCLRRSRFSRRVNRLADLIHQLFQSTWRSLETTAFGRVIYLNSMLPNEVVPDDIQYCLSRFKEPLIIVLDEVDQLVDEEAKNLLVATLKNLSDHSINTTIILVGVADTVGEFVYQASALRGCRLNEIKKPILPKIG